MKIEISDHADTCWNNEYIKSNINCETFLFGGEYFNDNTAWPQNLPGFNSFTEPEFFDHVYRNFEYFKDTVENLLIDFCWDMENDMVSDFGISFNMPSLTILKQWYLKYKELHN